MSEGKRPRSIWKRYEKAKVETKKEDSEKLYYRIGRMLESESLKLRSSLRGHCRIVTCPSLARRLSGICTVGHRRCTPRSIKASGWACLSTVAYPTPAVSSRFYTR